MTSPDRKAPLIGLTTDYEPPGDPEGFNHGRSFYYVNQDYVRMVQIAGGVALAVPPEPVEGNLPRLLDAVDGLLLIGGTDIDPAAYGEELMNPAWNVDVERTAFEAKLVALALERGVPILGICRGCQMLNVALGGSLYQDLAQQRRCEVVHRAGRGQPPARHPVRVEPGSKLSAILGVEELEVNSYHHQGIRELGSGLRAVAWSPDGLVEAVELPEKPFVLGVQWHPERDFDKPEQRRLLRAFVAAAKEERRRHGERKS